MKRSACCSAWLWLGEGRDAGVGARDGIISGIFTRDGAMGGCRGELRSAPPYKKNLGEALLFIRARARAHARARRRGGL